MTASTAASTTIDCQVRKGMTSSTATSAAMYSSVAKVTTSAWRRSDTARVSPCREDARPSPQHETDPSVFDAAQPTAHDQARRRRDGGRSAGRDRWLDHRDVLGEAA